MSDWIYDAAKAMSGYDPTLDGDFIVPKGHDRSDESRLAARVAELERDNGILRGAADGEYPPNRKSV